MKINDLIKQLNALKKIHGNVDVASICGMTGNSVTIQSVSTAHPLTPNSGYDRTKPAYAVLLNTWK